LHAGVENPRKLRLKFEINETKFDLHHKLHI